MLTRKKISCFAFVLLLFVIVCSVNAEPSIADYQIIIDGNSTNSTVVFISPQSTPGAADGLRINITANESVDWTITIKNSTKNIVTWSTQNPTTSIIRPSSPCTIWKGTKNQCDGDNLTDGNYTVNVTMKYIINGTDNGTISDSSRTILIDSTPPYIFINSPNTYLNNNTVFLNFTITDISQVSCIVEWTNQINISVNRSSDCNNDTFFGDDGNHIIRVWAADIINNTNVTTIFFVVDTVSPKINITSPENATYNSSSIDLNYSVSEPALCTRDLDGTNSTVANCTNVTLSNMLPGDHVLHLWANDSAGNVNVSSVIFKINYTEKYPSVSIQEPGNQTYLESNVFLNYTVFANQTNTTLACFYSLNNEPNQTLANCTNTTLSLADGSYFLQLFANNSYFINVSKVFFTVDTSAPPLTLNSPVNRTYDSTSVLISFVTSSDAICSYEINGAIDSLPGCQNETITVATGFNRITVYVKDDSGNTRSKSVNFTVSVPSSSGSQGSGSQSNQNNQNQQQQPQRNTTTNRTTPAQNPVINQTNQTEQSANETLNQSTNATSGTTGFAFVSPIPLETAALIAAVIIAIVAAFFALKKFKHFKKKPKENVVNNLSTES